MKVQSEDVDEEMTKFNIHLSELTLSAFQESNQPVIKWVLKAQEKVKN